jgi:hypothetical protein
MGAVAALVAVCLLQVSDDNVHHKRGHQNYYFEDFVCSEKNLPVEPETCGQIKDLLELKKTFTPYDWWLITSPETEFKLREFYQNCCLEA